MRSAFGVAVLGLLWLACGGAEQRPAPIAGSAGPGPQALRFALCASKVLAVNLTQSPDGKQSGVHVMLLPAAATELAALTEANVGRDLAVVYGSEIFVVRPITRRIRSGVITAAPLARDEAERQQRSLAALPQAPCGAGSAAEG